MDSAGSRVQNLPVSEQVLVVARLAQDRSENGQFSPSNVDSLFDEIGLPRPGKTSNVLATLDGSGLATRMKNVRGAWKLTLNGLLKVAALASDMDLAALMAETARPQATLLAATAHPVIPPSLAPPSLIGPLREFLSEYPFERNVFG